MRCFAIEPLFPAHRVAGTADLIQTHVDPQVTRGRDDIVSTGPGFTTTTTLNLDVTRLFDAQATNNASGLFAKGSPGVSLLVKRDGDVPEYTGLQTTTTNHNGFVDNQWLGTPVSVSLVPLHAAARLRAPAHALLARARRSRTV